MLLSGLSILPIVKTQEVKTGNITFQPNSIPDVNVYYQNRSFVFEYETKVKTFFIRVKPFVIYNGKYYGMNKIIQFLKSQNWSEANNYKWLVDKAVNAIHYGFNLTKLPQNVADKIDYLGFHLVDLNFPLSWFELEEVEFIEEGYNVTRIHIPKANLVFSFEDLYPYGYSIEHINSTYILIGNVKNRTDLYLDPITFSSSIITVTGYTEGTSCTFWDLWNASYVNGWNVSDQLSENASYGIGFQNTSYVFDCRIKIGDDATTTWFVDTNKQVVFTANAISASYQNLIDIRSQATFRLGILQDATTKRTSDGCQLIALDVDANTYFVYQDDWNTMELYSSTFSAPNARKMIRVYHQIARIYNCLFTKNIAISVRSNSNYGDFYNIHVQSVAGSFLYPQAESADKIYVTDCTTVFYIRYAGTFTNIYIRGATYIAQASKFKYGDLNLVNADSNTWDFHSWSVDSTSKVYRQYEFDLTVTTSANVPIEDANVTLTYFGEGGGIHGTWLTDVNGEIPSQVVTAGFYNQTGNYTYNPYEIKIAKDGYTTYQRNFTQLEQKSWNIALLTTSVTYTSAILIASLFLLIPIAVIFIVWRYGR